LAAPAYFAATDWAGIGQGLGGIVIAFTALYATVVNGRRIGATHAEVQEINHAVNGKPRGAQSIQSQVQDLHDDRPGEPPPGGRALLPMMEELVRNVAELRSLAADVAQLKAQLMENGDGIEP
jgi:hypothetical protein